jgi:acyl-CoA synthetase (NDP forming)
MKQLNMGGNMTSKVETRTSLKRMFTARSIAVVGASNDRKKFGYMTLDCLIRGGFDGELYPVNPKADEILGLKTYPSVSDLPGNVDLVSVIVPAKFVPGVIREAGTKGAVGAVVHSGGFSEAGNYDLEAELLAIAREHSMRIMGPNIQGINYIPNKMCCMFLPVIKTKGPLAVITQSGTVTTALTEWSADEGLGISAAVNLGNQADLCESDYLDFFAHDDETKVILMYIEGVKDGRRFLDALKEATSIKPVVMLKAGRTAVGQRSAASHTGSMASNYEVFAAACRQYGATVANDLEEAYDAAKALACMRPPRGNRLLSVSTSGGAGTLAGDHAEHYGIAMPQLSDAMVEGIKKAGAPPLAILSNPLDLVSLRVEDFEKVIQTADKYDPADVILLNLGDPLEGAVELADKLSKKLNASFVVTYFAGGEEEKRGRIDMHRQGQAVFATPERAVRGISAVIWYAEYRRKRGLYKGEAQ